MYIVFDIGATKMRIARSRDGRIFEAVQKIATPADFEEAIRVFALAAEDLREGEVVERAGGGIAGTLDKKHDMLLSSPNRPKWVGEPLKQELARAVGAPVILENDSAVVGLGEATCGAGRGADIVAYMTVSTGVGGARIVHGRIDASVSGFEPGHQIIDVAGTVCKECNAPGKHPDGVGHLEAYVSGTSVEQRFHKKPYDIPQDDPLWETLAEWLAAGLNNTIVHWSPDVVVLGGSMMTGDPVILVPRVEKYLAEMLKVFPERPAIKKATLGDEGGLYGALTLVSQKGA